MITQTPTVPRGASPQSNGVDGTLDESRAADARVTSVAGSGQPGD